MDIQSLKIDRAGGPARRGKAGRRGRSGPFGWLVPGIAVLALAAVVYGLRAPLGAFIDRLSLPRVELYAARTGRPADAGAVRGTAANGYVVASRRAALSADTPGRIVEMHVTEGTRVQQGQLVAKLFQDDLRASLAGAQAAIETARAEVVRAEASLVRTRLEVEQRRRSLEAAHGDVAEAMAQQQLAQARFARVDKLVVNRISAQDALDEARASLDGADARLVANRARQLAAKAAVADAEARVALAEAEVGAANARVLEAEAARDRIAANLAETEIRAPFGGIVVLKDAEVGEVVSPNSQGGSNARGSICTMVDFDSLEVQADVPESSLQAVALDALANIYLDAYPEDAYTGRVDRIWPVADRQKATIEVRIRFDQRDDRLRPDMGVRIVFLPKGSDVHAADASTPRQPTQSGMLVPTSALFRDTDGRDALFVYDRGTVRLTVVELAARDGRQAVVSSGLRVGDRIVLDPANLEDGDRVLLRGATP